MVESTLATEPAHVHQKGIVSSNKYHLVELTIGWAGLAGSERGLRRLSLKPTPQEVMEGLGAEVDGAEDDPTPFSEIEDCLRRYAAGDIFALNQIQLDLSGTPPFFKAAWTACRRIPPGETRSYAWLANEAGNPLAVRAAGQSMARNRFALIVPCHRVIASDGGLGGYGGGGLRVKARLLQMEMELASQ